MIKIPKL